MTRIMVFLDPVLASLGATGATDTILPYARAYAQIYVTGSIINVFTVMMNNLLTEVWTGELRVRPSPR